MEERLVPSRRELKEREALIAAHGDACPYAEASPTRHVEPSEHCPFIRHRTRKLSYCLLYLGWCRVLHPEMQGAEAFAAVVAPWKRLRGR